MRRRGGVVSRDATPLPVSGHRNLAPPPVSAWRNLMVPRVPVTELGAKDETCDCDHGQTEEADRATRLAGAGIPTFTGTGCGTPQVVQDPALHDTPMRIEQALRARRAPRAVGATPSVAATTAPPPADTLTRPDDTLTRPDDTLTRPDEPGETKEAPEVTTDIIAEVLYGLEVPNNAQVALAFASRLDLGISPTVEVPLGYTPSTSAGDMLSVLLTAWSKHIDAESANWAAKVIDRRTRAQLPTGTTLTGPLDWIEDAVSAVGDSLADVVTGAMSLVPGVSIADLSDPIPGLFWKEDYLNGALVMAVQTAHAFAPFLQIMPPDVVAAGGYRKGEFVRERLSGAPSATTDVVDRILIDDAPVLVPHVGGITIQPAGKVTYHSKPGVVAYTLVSTIWLRPLVRQSAALADYFFWWAHRLHSLAVETGKSELKELAQYAADCALTEIVEIASVIVHEVGHDSGWGSAWHCSNGQACKQYVAEACFGGATRALLGLPPSAVTMDGYTRDLSATSATYSEDRTPTDCDGTTIVIVHYDEQGASVLGRPHTIDLIVRVVSGCGGAGQLTTTTQPASALEALL